MLSTRAESSVHDLAGFLKTGFGIVSALFVFPNTVHFILSFDLLWMAQVPVSHSLCCMMQTHSLPALVVRVCTYVLESQASLISCPNSTVRTQTCFMSCSLATKEAELKILIFNRNNCVPFKVYNEL